MDIDPGLGAGLEQGQEIHCIQPINLSSVLGTLSYFCMHARDTPML